MTYVVRARVVATSIHSTHHWRHHHAWRLHVPNTHKLLATVVQFVAAPKIHNILRPAFGTCTSPHTFHRHIKAHYFQQAFKPTKCLFLVPLIWLLLTTLHIYKLHYFTLHYLLT